MKLYGSPNSPYVRQVRVLLREAGTASLVEQVDVDPRDPSTGFWSVNPIALIPALELPDGTVLTESDLICRHLDAAMADGRFYAPLRNDPRRLAALGLAQGILYRGLCARNEQLRPGRQDHDAFVARQLDAAVKGADVLERVAPDRVGEPDIVDLIVGCTIGWFSFRHAQAEVLRGRPRLARWFAELDARPAFAATRPG